MMNDRRVKPLESDYTKIFEEKLEFTFIDNYRVKLQVQDATFYDSIAMNIL